MVRAILDGRKTQTRRIIKPQREWGGEPMALWKCESCTDQWVWNAPDYPDSKEDHIHCPYGIPGDRLWVRETWSPYGQNACWYRADFSGPLNQPGAKGGGEYFNGWKPSIHMPRWASRITLNIIDVRVERVQEISEQDAVAESADPVGIAPNFREAFRQLWDSIHGKGAWDRNDWCWVLEFRKLS